MVAGAKSGQNGSGQLTAAADEGPHLSKKALQSLVLLIASQTRLQRRVHDDPLQPPVSGCERGHRGATSTSGPDDSKGCNTVSIDAATRTALIDLMARVRGSGRNNVRQNLRRLPPATASPPARTHHRLLTPLSGLASRSTTCVHLAHLAALVPPHPDFRTKSDRC
jgi:hypothetical protein